MKSWPTLQFFKSISQFCKKGRKIRFPRVQTLLGFTLGWETDRALQSPLTSGLSSVSSALVIARQEEEEEEEAIHRGAVAVAVGGIQEKNNFDKRGNGTAAFES